MATLAAISDNVRRRLGLGLGSHTVTLSYADIADQDTVTVHGIVLTCITGAAAVELAQFKKETNATATSDNLEDLIDAIFDSTTRVSASSSSGVTTITGARSVVTSNTTGFVISSSTTQDEPPFTSDIDQWILDGQLWLANMVVDEALSLGDTGLSKVTSFADSSGTSTEIAWPSDFMRSFMVTAKIGSDADLYRLTRVTLDELFEIRHDRHDLWKVDASDKAAKYYATAEGKCYFSAAPVTGSDKAKVYYIQEPQTTKGTECDLPDGLEPLLEDYAVIKAYEQKQRYDMAQALLGSLTLSIQVINTRYASAAARKRRR